MDTKEYPRWLHYISRDEYNPIQLILKIKVRMHCILTFNQHM